jgi:hypothetical protein
MVLNPSSVSVSGAGSIDELRLYPENAEMVSYTHDPLIGLTSQCDVNNRINYFKYDTYGRLSQIVDQDKNVLKKYCYNYAGQQENCLDCSEPTPPDWQNIGSPVCEQGPCGNTGYQLQQQMDMNSCTNLGVRYVNVGYNPGVCSPGSGTLISYANNAGLSGFTITYTDRVTGQPYSFAIPGSGSGVLGCIPSASYTISISKPGNNIYLTFGLGCTTQSGTSAYWAKINIPGFLGSCNMVTLDAGM